MPATRIHSLGVQLILGEARHVWRLTRGGEKERVRRTTSHQQSTLASLSFPSIYGNQWIIYKPLPLTPCVWACVREREKERGGIFAELTTTTMLRTAAVSAATAAVWLLALLGPGLSLAAEDNPEPDFSLCSHCFYRQTPPRGASAGLPLRPSCHTLPGGQAFATLSKPTCDTAVYSAFRVSHEGTDREGQEEGEPVVRMQLSRLLK